MKKSGLFGKLTLIAFAIVIRSNGQSISGEWIGSVEKNSIFCKKPTLFLKLKQSTDGNIAGYIIYDYGKEEYEKYIVSGIIDSIKGKIVIVEDTLIQNTVTDTIPNSAVGMFLLRFPYPDSLLFLKGNWSDRSKNFIKADNFSVLFKKVDEGFPAVTERKNEIRDSIFLKYDPFDSVYIQVFDNGTIDNDTISLYLNETCLLAKQRISSNPISIGFAIPENSQELLLKLIAENYGDIPPNTAAIRISANKKNFLFNILSTKWVNGSILIRLSQ
jgi:hypothetical protein